jgi:twitching motility protein PilT
LSKTIVAVLAQQLVPSVNGRRVGAFELMMATPGVRSLIADPACKHALLANEIATGSAHGMISMDQSIADLHRRRLIDRVQALRFAVNPGALEPQLAPRRQAQTP